MRRFAFRNQINARVILHAVTWDPRLASDDFMGQTFHQQCEKIQPPYSPYYSTIGKIGVAIFGDPFACGDACGERLFSPSA